MRTTSWVLLTIVGALTLLAGLASSYLAYRGTNYPIGNASLSEVSAGRPAVETALRAQRGTAAAYAAGFATLFLFTVLGPYRRGDVAAWWTILAGTLALALVSGARIVFLGTLAGAIPVGIQLVVVVVALLLDMRRLSKPSPAS